MSEPKQEAPSPTFYPLPHPPPDLKSRLKTSYDAIAPAYNAWTQQHNKDREASMLVFLEHLQQKLADKKNAGAAASSKRPKVLELGCGAGGVVTQMLLDAGIDLVGNDLSETQLRLARERFAGETEKGEVRWVQGDMTRLEFERGELDGVVGLYSMIHLPREEQKVMLQRVAGWVREGGVVLVNFGAEELEGEVIEQWLGDGGWMYWSGWGEEGSVRMVEEAGFEVVSREVKEEEPPGARFVWIVGRRKGKGGAESG
ncbi:hypothetical protein VTI74DRAFT_5565 [Chaetomium olivicolor]